MPKLEENENTEGETEKHKKQNRKETRKQKQAHQPLLSKQSNGSEIHSYKRQIPDGFE
jgi:hypothetical protein